MGAKISQAVARARSKSLPLNEQSDAATGLTGRGIAGADDC